MAPTRGDQIQKRSYPALPVADSSQRMMEKPCVKWLIFTVFTSETFTIRERNYNEPTVENLGCSRCGTNLFTVESFTNWKYSRKRPMLKPHDLMVAFKLVAILRSEWSYKDLSASIGLSPPGLHKSIRRLIGSGIVYDKDKVLRVAHRKLANFAIHGAPTVFYPQRGQISRGLPTSTFAAPLMGRFSADKDEIPVVWPTSTGSVRGESLVPLYPSAPKAAETDTTLYELLSLFDVIRVGRTRERKAAAEILDKKLGGQEDA